MGAAVRADFIRGIGKHGNRFLLVLDVDKVFSSDEILDLAQMMGEGQPAVTGKNEDADDENLLH